MPLASGPSAVAGISRVRKGRGPEGLGAGRRELGPQGTCSPSSEPALVELDQSTARSLHNMGGLALAQNSCSTAGPALPTWLTLRALLTSLHCTPGAQVAETPGALASSLGKEAVVDRQLHQLPLPHCPPGQPDSRTHARA